MDLNDIIVFTKVVETKSFTGAADAMGLPKSSREVAGGAVSEAPHAESAAAAATALHQPLR